MFGLVAALMAVGIAFLGLLFASEATLGVAIIGFAGVIGIFARVAQAYTHHDALTKLMAEREREEADMQDKESVRAAIT